MEKTEEKKETIYICPKCGAVGTGYESGATCFKCGHPVMHASSYSKEEWLGLSGEEKNDAIRLASLHADNALLKALTESKEELTIIKKWVMFLGIVVIVEIVGAVILLVNYFS